MVLEDHDKPGASASPSSQAFVCREDDRNPAKLADYADAAEAGQLSEGQCPLRKTLARKDTIVSSGTAFR
jgi:hypothetical protein